MAAAINKSEYFRLMQLIETLVQEKDLDGETERWILQDSRQLQHLFATYQSRLLQLRTIIAEYETVHRSVRVKLRRQKIMNQQKLKLCL